LQLAFVWVVTYVMGLVVVKALLPDDIEALYGTLIAPTVGYLAFCLAAFTISASFKTPAPAASWIAMASLVLSTAASQLNPRWRIDLRSAGRQLRLAAVLVLPMLAVTLVPLLYFGPRGYLGAVNPDFFAGVVDNYFLLQGHSVATFSSTTTDTWYPIDYGAGRLSFSARFGAGM